MERRDHRYYRLYLYDISRVTGSSEGGTLALRGSRLKFSYNVLNLSSIEAIPAGNLEALLEKVPDV